MSREYALNAFYMIKEANKKSKRPYREHWSTRPLMSAEGIDKMERFADSAIPYMFGAVGAGIGALAINVPPYVSKGHKPTSALGYAVGGAAGYGLGKLLQDPKLKKTSAYSRY